MNVDGRPTPPDRDERAARLATYVTRAQAGDLTALEPVVDELNPLLWHVARSQGLTAEDAADVVQTTWLELVRHIQDIRSPLALTSWLVITTKREAWHTRVSGRRDSRPGDDFLEKLAVDVPEPDERLGAEEEYQALRRSFARLPERCRVLLRVVSQTDRPDYAMIGKALGMPHGSIGPTRGRCLDKLRALLLADPAWRVA
jgi:RNA polymerase sigma factor (sigma-70 family)